MTYLRTLSAPTPTQQQRQQHHNHNDVDTNPLPADNDNNAAATSSNRNAIKYRNSLAATAGGAAAAITAGNSIIYTASLNENLTNLQSNEAALNALTMASNARSNDNAKAVSTPTTPTTTVLKIEETTTTTAAAASDLESLQQKRLRQLNNEMDSLRLTSIDQSQQLSTLMQQNHYCLANNAAAMTANNHKHKNCMTSAGGSTVHSSNPNSQNLLTPKKSTGLKLNGSHNATAGGYIMHAGNGVGHHNDATKKGSTSTIWTSEESILRSVGAVDEDNK